MDSKERLNHVPFQLVTNTSCSLMDIRRYGAAALALRPVIRGMEQRGLSLAPDDYPDRGPAMEALPEININGKWTPVAEDRIVN